VVDVVKELRAYDTNVAIYDPWADPEEVKREYDLDILTAMPAETFDATILAVAHETFKGVKVNSKLIYCVKAL
jgi:UDP-N-acetyl-D-galactosamine dehydrogenase